MCPTDVVEGNGHHHQHHQCEHGAQQHQQHCENESAAVAEGGKQQTNGGGKDSDHCCSGGHALPQVSVAATSVAPSSIGVENLELLSKMREACERQNCSTKDVSDATLLRFLRARSLKVEKAAKMFENHQHWRASYIPLGYVPDSECPRELAAKKYFLQGRSRLGWAVAIIHGRHHYALERGLEELRRKDSITTAVYLDFTDLQICWKSEFGGIVYFLDKAIASAAPEAEKMLIIVDLNNIGFGNLDARGFIAGFGFLQAYYPERLAKCLMVNAPSIFLPTWKVINRFMDPETRSKIVFVEQGKIMETCLSDIDMEVLPVIYGGKAKLTLLQDAVVPNWPPGKNV